MCPWQAGANCLFNLRCQSVLRQSFLLKEGNAFQRESHLQCIQEEHLVNHGDQESQRIKHGYKTYSRWWFQIYLFSPLFGEMIQFDSYFSDGLKHQLIFLKHQTVSWQDHPTTLGSNWSLHHVFFVLKFTLPAVGRWRLHEGKPLPDLLVEMFFLLQCFYRHQKYVEHLKLTHAI